MQMALKLHSCPYWHATAPGKSTSSCADMTPPSLAATCTCKSRRACLTPCMSPSPDQVESAWQGIGGGHNHAAVTQPCVAERHTFDTYVQSMVHNPISVYTYVCGICAAHDTAFLTSNDNWGGPGCCTFRDRSPSGAHRDLGMPV